MFGGVLQMNIEFQYIQCEGSAHVFGQKPFDNYIFQYIQCEGSAG